MTEPIQFAIDFDAKLPASAQAGMAQADANADSRWKRETDACVSARPDFQQQTCVHGNRAMEPFMTMRYLIVRYIPDLARQEPKNIGVLLASSRGVMAKFLGERDAKLDLRSVRSLVSHTGTYKQWIDYWRHVISQEADPDTKLNQVLESSRGNFVVSEGDVVYLPPDIASDPHKTLNHLFFLLVSEFPAQQEEEAELSFARTRLSAGRDPE